MKASYCTILALCLLSLAGVTLSAQNINSIPWAEFFDTTEFPNLPSGWSSIVQFDQTYPVDGVEITDEHCLTPPHSIFLYNYLDENAVVLLVSPQLDPSLPLNQIRCRFNLRGYYQDLLQVGFLSDPADPATFTAIGSFDGLPAPNWKECLVNFYGQADLGRYFAFKHGGCLNPLIMYLDNVRFEWMPANDLAAVELTGSQTPTQGAGSVYTVRVQNNGTTPQSGYQVILEDGAGTLIDSQLGIPLQPNQSADFDLVWAPDHSGPDQIRGRVVQAGDEDSVNNPTQLLAVEVNPAGVHTITAGTGAYTGKVPIDFYWRTSIYETLYYPEDLPNFNGDITALRFHFDFVSTILQKPIRLWLGTTNLPDLSAGWIPSTELTLVFDGPVDIDGGDQDEITFNLIQPFAYNGEGNLVLMALRPRDTEYFMSLDDFYCQSFGRYRSRKAQDDVSYYDTANPPLAGVTLNGEYPLTTFIFEPAAVSAPNDLPGPASPRLQIYPNPFNPSATISYTLPEAGPVELSIYNLKGQLVKTLADGTQTYGNHSAVWDGRDRFGGEASSGIYLCRLKTPFFTVFQRMVIMK